MLLNLLETDTKEKKHSRGMLFSVTKSMNTWWCSTGEFNVENYVIPHFYAVS